MDPRPPQQSPPPRPVRRAAQPGEGAGARVRVGPWRPPRRLLPLALIPVLVYLALWLMVGYSLGTGGCRGARPAVPLLGGPAVEVLVESEKLALPPSAACNRFDAGWEARHIRDQRDRQALVPHAGSGRLQVVNLGEEVPRTLTLDLARDELPEGERLSIRSGDRELARATLRAAALPLRVRLPEDLPVGQLSLDLVFGPGQGGAGGDGARPGLPALYGATLAPALPAGHARTAGADLWMDGNCLVYLRCRLAGNEALVGTFVPPAAARPGQRFELTVERQDGSPIRRFRWLPSFWNRWRGARGFELPLRGARGPVRVRLVSRAGDAGGPAGRWHALGLIDVTGKILTPGQGQ
jgi:hypothetical protein